MKFLSKLKSLVYILFIINALLLSSCKDEPVPAEEIIEDEIVYDKYGFIADSLDVIHGTVKKNEIIADILGENGIGYSMVTEIYERAKPKFDFRKIQPNKSYTIYKTYDSLSSFYGFVYEINKVEFIKIQFVDSIKVELVERVVDINIRNIAGVINSSLYETLQEKNSSIVLAGKIAEVFAWQIDFYTIQKGDEFYAVYEELSVDNEVVGIGDILTSKFIHKSNEFNAFLFEQNGKHDYFDEEGMSLQKEFLKAPLKYKRISSRYSGKRLHPILRIYRPHRGIDYAAAVGTPVQSVGDGVVIQVGRNGGAGRMVKIRHNSVYTSAYLHLSGYGKGIRSGVKVRQGQVIGYVGSSGLSTGPHLDFRFWKNGSLVNYLNQSFPASKSVEDSNMTAFAFKRDSLANMLNSILELN